MRQGSPRAAEVSATPRGGRFALGWTSPVALGNMVLTIA